VYIVRYRKMDGQFSSDSVARIRRKTVYLLLGSLLLSVGTPAYLALTRSGARFYLLQPMIFAMQAIPYVLAAGLWLPWRSACTSTIGVRLAGVLFFADVLLYVPILTGLLPTGGDMIALGFLMIAMVTTVSILVVTLAAFGVSWMRRRSATSSVPPLE
jgi:hypothetical protein